MANLEQLLFAQRFPFSARAKEILKEIGLSLEDVPEETINRAVIMVSYAFKGKEYVLDIKSSDLLEQEIAAFPVAKILVSLVGEDQLYRGFASMISKSAFFYLEKSPNRKQLALDLAEDLGIEFKLAEENGFFVSVTLNDFLSANFKSPALKLVNQSVEAGRVFLNVNTLCRFISGFVFSMILNGLPVPTAGLPSFYRAMASQLKGSKEVYSERVAFKVEGKINPNAFPPCFASLYQKQMSGESLPHMARFLLASFLNAVGLPEKSIFDAFKKSPNFDERVASYQIKRIVAQNYAPASCEKVKGYGFCQEQDCRVKNPVGYYRRQLRKLSAKKPVSEIQDKK